MTVLLGGRASDGGVAALGGVLSFGGVLSEFRGADSVGGLGGEVGGVLRLPASGLTYALGGEVAGVLLRPVWGLAYRLGSGVDNDVRAVVARLRLVPKLGVPELEGFSSGGPFTGDAGTIV